MRWSSALLLFFVAVIALIAPGLRAASAGTAPALTHLAPAKFWALPELRESIDVEALNRPLLAAAIFHETNRRRAAEGMPALQPLDRLNDAADMQAAMMALRQQMGHENPIPRQGTPWLRVKETGLEPEWVAENVAMTPVLDPPKTGLFVRIENDVDRARVFVLAQDFSPSLAAVGRAKNSALRVRSVGMPDRGDEDNVRVIRVHDERADMAGVFQSDVVPIAPAVDGFIDAIAVGDVAAQAGLAGARVDGVMIARRDGERSDRGSGVLLVEQRLPIGAAICRFPDSTSHATEVIGVRLARYSLDRDRPAAAMRSDLAPLHSTPKFGVE